MPPPALLDLGKVDFSQVLADKTAVQKVIPQRFEMAQLDAIVFEDKNITVGYKDITHEEFWIRGHMPDFPLMPGVMLCEAGAQLCSYFLMKDKKIDCDFMGFGGMEEVVFRKSVFPGQRLILIAEMTKVNRRQIVSEVQGFVKNGEDFDMVFHARIIGMPLRSPKS